jgi:3-deoxy-7-phosphoheptulonate synthase
MIIEMNQDIDAEELDELRERLESGGWRTHVGDRGDRILIGCVAEPAAGSPSAPLDLPAAAKVHERDFRLTSKDAREHTVVHLGEAGLQSIGGGELALIAGPCSVEGPEMIMETARAARVAGAGILRGGAFKPRTSPYAFQGLGAAALEMLSAVRAETGMPVVAEVLDPRQVELACAHVDMLQIGARNMQNYALLQEVGRVGRPVLLKRGLSATIEELLLAAEHVMAAGGRDVVLCERGIRTYERATRNTLDIAAVPVLKRETHLPVIVDPSHAGGRVDLVAPLAFAAVAAGADGLMVEVHPRPAAALSDGDQSLTCEAFAELVAALRPFASAAGRLIGAPLREVAA